MISLRLHYVGFIGDENTVDVGTDDNLLLAYHFHIPEGLCGEFLSVSLLLMIFPFLHYLK